VFRDHVPESGLDVLQRVWQIVFEGDHVGDFLLPENITLSRNDAVRKEV